MPLLSVLFHKVPMVHKVESGLLVTVCFLSQETNSANSTVSVVHVNE